MSTPKGSVRRVAALATCLTLAGSVCTDPPGLEGPGQTRVTIRTFAFRPSSLRIRPGTTVTWSNEDRILHTVTSGIAREQGVPGIAGDVPAKPDGLFDEALDGAGTTASFTFSEAGTYEYFCDVHAGMTGRIVVR